MKDPFRPFRPVLIIASNMSASALQPLVEALLNELPEDESSGVPVITVKQDGLPTSPASTPKQGSRQPVYDPSVVYILELCTVLALRNADTIEALGKKVADALQAILRHSSRFHTILVSRAAFYQFNILKASYVSTFTCCGSLRLILTHLSGTRLCSSSGIIAHNIQLVEGHAGQGSTTRSGRPEVVY